MSAVFVWFQHGAEYRAEMPGNITLVVAPDKTSNFGTKAKRGTTWTAQASHWNEVTRTLSRYGRDEYGVKHSSFKAAMRAAENIYNDA